MLSVRSWGKRSVKSKVHTKWAWKLICLNSRCLNPAICFRKGTSQANNLISFMPSRSSWSNFALLSVHSMVLHWVRNNDFINLLCIGVRMTKTEKPARALRPMLEISRPRQIPNWISAAQDTSKNSQQKSIWEMSVEIWLNNLSVDSIALALVVRRREREWIAVLRLPQIRTPDEFEQ